MKEILDYLCYEVPVRRNGGTKLRFLVYLKDGFEKIGLRCKLWKPHKSKMMNLVVGDPETADTVILTGYDTPRKILVPNYRYYPLNSVNNTKNERIGIIVQMLCVFLLVVGMVAASYALSLTGVWYKIPGIILCCIIGFLAALSARGIPNKNNLNKNSAALAIVLKFLQLCDIEKNKTAVVLLDSTADSYQGYNAVKAALKDKLANKNIIILEALAEGKTNFMATNVEKGRIKDTITQSNGFDVVTVEKTEKADNLVNLFDRTYYFFCGERRGEDIVISNTRTRKDCFYSMENMEAIYAAIRSCFK